jgi:hypothetical protein
MAGGGYRQVTAPVALNPGNAWGSTRQVGVLTLPSPWAYRGTPAFLLGNAAVGCVRSVVGPEPQLIFTTHETEIRTKRVIGRCRPGAYL